MVYPTVPPAVLDFEAFAATAAETVASAATADDDISPAILASAAKLNSEGFLVHGTRSARVVAFDKFRQLKVAEASTQVRFFMAVVLPAG